MYISKTNVIIQQSAVKRLRENFPIKAISTSRTETLAAVFGAWVPNKVFSQRKRSHIFFLEIGLEESHPLLSSLVSWQKHLTGVNNIHLWENAHLVDHNVSRCQISIPQNPKSTHMLSKQSREVENNQVLGTCISECPLRLKRMVPLWDEFQALILGFNSEPQLLLK